MEGTSLSDQLDQRTAKEVSKSHTKGSHGKTGHVLVCPQGNGQEAVEESHAAGTPEGSTTMGIRIARKPLISDASL